jgi:hypothetical protein
VLPRPRPSGISFRYEQLSRNGQGPVAAGFDATRLPPLGTAGGTTISTFGRPASATGTITGFGQANTNGIDLLDKAATAISYTTLSSSNGVLAVTGTAGSIATLHFSGGDYQRSQFHYAVVGGSTHITFM